MSQHPIHVFSEIGKLKKVMLHRHGKEIENLVPDSLERLLFDDIPFLEDAQKEHDDFAQALRDEGVEVLYLETLAAESLVNQEVPPRDAYPLFLKLSTAMAIFAPAWMAMFSPEVIINTLSAYPFRMGMENRRRQHLPIHRREQCPVYRSHRLRFLSVFPAQ